MASITHPKPLLLLMFLLLQIKLHCLLASGTYSNHTVRCLPGQASALLRLKRSFSFNYSRTTLQSWRADTDCCRWEGIGCHAATGQVTFLDLSERHLQSNGLDPALFRLTSIQHLNLAGNDFNMSHLPTTGFERLTELTHLNLSYSNFCGQILIGVGHLTNLVSLDLSGYCGSQYQELSFQSLVANLSNLRELYLDSVNISNSVPEWCSASVESIPKLEILSLGSCSLSGPIGQSLSCLRSLVVVNLQSNALSGRVPEFFADFPSLSVLQLSDNNLEGWFPSRIFRHRKLATLDVSFNANLSGYLPNFSTDSCLENLDLSGTNFSGIIPSSIGNLKSLKTLDLSQTIGGFSGKLPSSIGKLKSLNLLKISGLGLQGSIPSSIANLKSLTMLDLFDCGLSGSIPTGISNLKNMRALILSNCNFSGAIPSWISNLTQLDTLMLDSNNFMGTVELTSFWKLRYLSDLGLSNNRLSVVDGEDNSSFISFPKIQYLYLASCNISKFPDALRHLDEINELDLSFNQIHGAIPEWTWETWKDNLLYLNVSHNKLTGIERSLSLLPVNYLQYLDLSFNMFEGPLPIPQRFPWYLDYSNNQFSSIVPNFTAYLNDTIFFKISRNNLSGKLPPSICSARNLQILDLSYNNFSGSIPSCLIEDANRLRILNMRANQFQSVRSHNTKEGCTLESIDLNNNWIEGQLPRSLASCKNLEVLDIGNNRILDSFPCWLSMLPKLQVIVLKSNQFFGQLGHPLAGEKSSCEFPGLRIFDIASNNFTGTVQEEWFKSFKSMMVTSNNVALIMTAQNVDRTYWYTVTVTFKGIDNTFVKILKTFVIIDISNNAFNGHIPESMGRLVLLRGLNMSRNALTGQIPSQLGGLNQLESLDLSSNELSGKIPQELTSLNFLEILNLSYNKLVGTIPELAQFSTFGNSSFLGNTGLCGTPLSKQCSNASTPNTVPFSVSTNEASKKKSTDILLFLFVGLGFGVGFAIVIVLKWGICIRK